MRHKGCGGAPDLDSGPELYSGRGCGRGRDCARVEATSTFGNSGGGIALGLETLGAVVDTVYHLSGSVLPSYS